MSDPSDLTDTSRSEADGAFDRDAHPELGAFFASLDDLASPPADAATRLAHVSRAVSIAAATAPGAATTWRTVGWRVAAVAAASAVVVGTLGADDRLPEPAQRMVSSVAEVFGVDVPDGSDRSTRSETDDEPPDSQRRGDRQDGERPDAGTNGDRRPEDAPRATPAVPGEPGEPATPAVPADPEKPERPETPAQPETPPSTSPPSSLPPSTSPPPPSAPAQTTPSTTPGRQGEPPSSPSSNPSAGEENPGQGGERPSQANAV